LRQTETAIRPLGIIYVLLVLPAVLLTVFFATRGVAIIPVLLIAGLYIVILAIVFMTLTTLFLTGVYIYATAGHTPVFLAKISFRAHSAKSRGKTPGIAAQMRSASFISELKISCLRRTGVKSLCA
jgi:hypothetical protein